MYSFAVIFEQVCSRHPPFGNGVSDAVKCLPKYEMALDQEVRIALTGYALSVLLPLAKTAKQMPLPPSFFINTPNQPLPRPPYQIHHHPIFTTISNISP